MAVTRIDVNIDCTDADALAGFWCEVLGYERLGEAGQYRSIVPVDGGSGPKLIFQQVPEPRVAKNRLHLDLIVDDVDAEAARLEALGARQAARHEEFGIDWVVMADPEGNEFCLCSS